MRYVFTFEFLLFAVAMGGFALVAAHLNGNSQALNDILDFLRSK